MQTHKDPDIVIYHQSAFEHDSIETRPLGGTETSEIYLTKYFAENDLKPVIFCDCKKPGIYNGVSYMNISEFDSYNLSNRMKVFISQTNPSVFAKNINANIKYYWTAGTYAVRANQPLKEKTIQAKIDKFIFLSNWHADSSCKYFGIDKKKAFITRNGINPELFADRSIKRDRYRLIYSSEPARGLDVLLDIFPSIKKKFPQASLYLFSDYELYGQKKGSAFTELDKVFAKAKQPGIFNLGNIKQKDLAKEFLKSSILAYPTHFEETSCITAIEAQAAGVPVLTSSLAALKETVINDKTGLLVNGNSRSWLYKYKFLKQMNRLLSDDALWNRFSANGIERVNNNYTWEQVAKEWIREFKPYL